MRDASGEAEGLTFDEMCERYGPNYGFVPGAEYFPDWLPQAIARLRGLITTYPEQTILAFTHFAVVKAAFVAFANTPPTDLARIAPRHAEITEWSWPPPPPRPPPPATRPPD